jgi:hypothetical protein
MKSLKFALVAAIVACTMVSLAYADGIQEKPRPIPMPGVKKIVNIDFQKALTCPGLVKAMYQQVTKDEILHSQSHIFFAMVTYDGNTYRIKGTLDQWFKFLMRGGLMPIKKPRGPAFEE